ncbi:MAG: hypothetical protein ACLUJG_18355 [Lawsonibacter sp.]
MRGGVRLGRCHPVIFYVAPDGCRTGPWWPGSSSEMAPELDRACPGVQLLIAGGGQRV